MNNSPKPRRRERPAPSGAASLAAEEPSLTWRVRPIGILRAPFSVPVEAPPHFTNIGRATLRLFTEFEAGLDGIEGFSHLWLLVLLNRSEGFDLIVGPKGRRLKCGVFATRESRRPNPIGLTLVELVRREGASLMVLGSDLCDHTPVLDIKPYLPGFDHAESPRLGWCREDP